MARRLPLIVFALIALGACDRGRSEAERQEAACNDAMATYDEYEAAAKEKGESVERARERYARNPMGGSGDVVRAEGALRGELLSLATVVEQNPDCFSAKDRVTAQRLKEEYGER